MNGKERMFKILKREKPDRIGLYESFWSDTQTSWTEQGKIQAGENMADHFGFDIEQCRPCNLTADIHRKPEIIEETGETILRRDGNGAVLRWHKLHNTTPEHVDFLVKDGEAWHKHIKPLLHATEDRINFESYKKVKKRCEDSGRFFVFSEINVFECMHPVCGHENMLAGMVLEPEWIKDMVNTYTDMIISLMEITFSKCGKPDGVWFFEDLGFKGHPFISPEMYKEFIFPAHKKIIDFAHSQGLPYIMHSCGFIEPLLPLIVESGIDCLQAIEIKSGMDLIKLYKEYGEKIALMGGIDVRVLYSNNKQLIDAELEAKIPVVKQGFGYTLHSDHSIPQTVNYDTYKYFIEKGLSLGQY